MSSSGPTFSTTARPGGPSRAKGEATDPVEGGRDEGYEAFSPANLAFSLLFLVGMYTGVDLYYRGALLLPSYLCLLAALYFVFDNRRKLKVGHALFFLGLVVLTVLNITFSPGNEYFLLEKAKGLVQIVYSVMIGLLFFLNMSRKDPRKVSKILLFSVYALIGGAFLERVNVITGLSESFRYAVYPIDFVYASDLRDISLYGAVRPKLFTAEPSHVAIFFLVALYYVYLAAGETKAKIKVLALAGVAFLLVKSPIILLLYPAAVMAEVIVSWNTGGSDGFPGRKKWMVVLVMVLSLALMAYFVKWGMGTRIELIASGMDTSFLSRNVVGVIALAKVIALHPLWGSGITGKEVIEDIIYESYLEVGMMDYSIYSFNNNFLMIFIIYYGLVGSGLFVLLFYRLLRTLELENVTLIFCSIAVFSLTMGAFVSVRTWGCIFMVLLASGSVGAGARGDAALPRGGHQGAGER